MTTFESMQEALKILMGDGWHIEPESDGYRIHCRAWTRLPNEALELAFARDGHRGIADALSQACRELRRKIDPEQFKREKELRAQLHDAICRSLFAERRKE